MNDTPPWGVSSITHATPLNAYEIPFSASVHSHRQDRDIMTFRPLILACLLLVLAFASLQCHNDRQIIDKHEQALLEEDD